MDSAEFPARRDAFPQVRTFVEDTCARAGVAREDCLRLTLLVEELFMNTVVHGHGGDTDAPVRLALTMTPVAIAVRYEDTASPFNPFSTIVSPDDDATLEEREVGGLGVWLVSRMAHDVGYASRDGGNQVTFLIARSG